jgi:predicted enzyme related to lactoylglutathione lyase
MITRIKTQAVYASNQEEALRFWTEKVGFELRSEQQMGPEARWIEVAPPGADSCIVIYPRSMMEDWAARQPSVVFACEDTEATHRELSDRGVQFSRPPVKMAWGTFAAFFDPDGTEFGIRTAPERR